MPKGLLIKQPASNDRHYGLMFRARDAERFEGRTSHAHSGGPDRVDLGNTNDVTAFFGDDKPVNLDFGRAPAVFEVLSGNSHVEIKGSILNARGLTVRGKGGRVLLSGTDLDVTGPASVESAWLGLTGKAALPGIKALSLSGRSTIILQSDEASVIDRLPDSAPISCAGRYGDSFDHRREYGFPKRSSERSRLTRIAWSSGHPPRKAAVHAHTRRTRAKPEHNFDRRLRDAGSGQPGQLNNDKIVLDALVGGGGAEGSTTVSIIPWARGHGGGNLYSAAGFLTYSRGDGFRELVKDREYVQDPNAASKPTDNVRIAAGETRSRSRKR